MIRYFLTWLMWVITVFTCILSWPIFVVNKHRRAVIKCLFKLCLPCYFPPTLSCENTGEETRQTWKGSLDAPLPLFLCLFTRTRRHLYIVSKHKKVWRLIFKNLSGKISWIGSNITSGQWSWLRWGESGEAIAIIRTMTATNCNHCHDEVHNQKLLESARKMSSQSGSAWRLQHQVKVLR